MTNAIEWIKSHKLTSVLIVIIIYLLFRNNNPVSLNTFNVSPTLRSTSMMAEKSVPNIGGAAPDYIAPQTDYAPTADVKDRMVIQESYLSFLVKNVRETADQIIAFAQNAGGYMVNSSINSADEAPTGNISIRVPSKDLDNTLASLRKMAVKVVSENLTGTDVTDQYTDLDARLETLNKTKTKFEEILDKAYNVQDILTVQKELINLQSQIDSIKGQQLYLSKSAQMAKLTIYLSTDEISLPYAPSESWRPNVIFKLAVRSLVVDLRGLGTKLIWLTVYAVIWLPILIIGIIAYRIYKNRCRRTKMVN